MFAIYNKSCPQVSEYVLVIDLSGGERTIYIYMFNFESPTQQDSGAQSYKENMHGLEGICEECHGVGRTDQGFF